MFESAAQVGLESQDGPLTLDRFGAESARIGREVADRYHRYRIETEEVDDAQPLPHRFLVKVGKVGLAKFIAKEMLMYFGQFDVILSSPCVVYESPRARRSGFGRTLTKSGCWTQQRRHPTHSLGLGAKPPTGPENTP